MTTVRHDASSELRQQPSDDEWWQDSAFVTWYSAGAGIGGIVRIGHEPNYEGGVVALWFGLSTKDGLRYRRNTCLPLTEADRLSNGFGAHQGAYRLVWEDDALHLRVQDDELSLDLTIHDFYPRTDFFPPTAGSLVDDFASSHFETSGQITGTVHLADRIYDVDGLCHRDRSWGTRRWDTLLNHRWIPGTVGPALSFGSISWHATDGSLRQFGYVVRDGVVTHASEIDVLVGMEADGVSPRNATATWRFADGDELVVHCTPIDGTVSMQHGVACLDNICEVTIDGRVGFCDLELSTNPRGGQADLTLTLGASMQNGLSRRPN
jgi:hypothetical protein